MAGIKSGAQLAKKCLIFGLEDVLIPGKLDKNVKMKNVFSILKKLKGLEEKFPKFRFFAITGYSANEAFKRLEQFKLGEYFPEGRVYYVNQKYLSGREDIDRQLYEKKISENPEFKDEYFKQVIIEEIEAQYNYSKEEMVLVGHDLWTEGYYTMRFSKIDFALIRSAHSSLGERKPDEIKGINYIERNWADIERLLKAELPKPDYAMLDKFVINKMKEKLFEGTKMGALSKIAKA